MADTNASNELLHDLSPLLKAYKDGRVERLMDLGFVPPSPLDQETNVRSKDVVISPEIGLSARLYLPNNPSNKKLPLLIYFHGGGFLIESAFSPTYQNHLNRLVSHAQVVALSVNYRSAPEHPLPTAYEDSWEVLKWVSTKSQTEEWINEFADTGRVYLAGDSAGANIAHNMAMRVGSEKPGSNGMISVSGIFLNCPYFLGNDSVGNEAENPLFQKSFLEKLWRFACPKALDCDDPLINPGKDPKISSLGCKKVLVLVAEKDVLRDRGWYHKEVLEKSEWNGKVEVVEVEGEGHVFSVFDPKSENAVAMFKRLASFVSDDQ